MVWIEEWCTWFWEVISCQFVVFPVVPFAVVRHIRSYTKDERVTSGDWLRLPNSFVISQ